MLAEGSLHGYRLAERIGEISIFGGGKPDGAGVYRFLKAMKGRGMVASSWVLSDTGPARSDFFFTVKRRTMLADELDDENVTQERKTEPV